MTRGPAPLAVEIEKRLGAFHLRCRFSVQPGELIVLFGHSGSGKSLSLRAVAGLLRPDRGWIEIGGSLVFDGERGIDAPPQVRGVGMVVQNYALFPHMTVADNVAFGLDRFPPAERRARVDELLALLDIDSLADRRPHAISGGQAQRVALARALAPRPRLLLLDEPFSALDTAIRVTLRRELVRLKHELNLTIVFVTHDLREAYNLADTIAVFDAGEVLQCGARDQVFNEPASARVAELTEVRNIWRGTVAGVEDGVVTVDTGAFLVRGRGTEAAPGASVAACIRPERVLLRREPRSADPPGVETLIDAEIVEEVPHGASHTLVFRVCAEEGAERLIEVDLASMPYEVLGVRGRRRWTLALPANSVHVMPDR